MSDRKSSILPFFFVITFFSVFVIPFFLFSSLSSLLPLFCFRHSATNYQVIQNAEVNNQKKQKIKFSHKR